jgi:hypothetical protein
MAPPKRPSLPDTHARRPRPCVAEMDARVSQSMCTVYLRRPRIWARRGLASLLKNVLEEISCCTVQYSIGPVLKLCSGLSEDGRMITIAAYRRQGQAQRSP